MTYPVLALDVATKHACVCLIDAQGQVFTAEASEGKQHSDTVLPLLERVLQQADLTWPDLKMLVLGQGPGSFTGLRIAAAMLAGINASLKLPIWGLSSLAITAMQTQSDKPLWILEDARAGEVFAGYYHQGECLQGDVCKCWNDVQDMPVGIFAAHQEPAISLADWQRLPLNLERAKAMSLLIQTLWDKTDHTVHTPWIQPVYLQLSQAEKNLQHG
ncbi:MAG: tRNA (adenosine(37)-N6)-threonylcarbamoyltransferase complex dimerization subunit type 1 TsaB [Mariprofundaceae bacterium]|nr:tRNA (adenosine(37)-N6)-threonylcarbamoyltransferase complex dimerization subunit type 1 TsaB [Mariprofundaceae bacterium]